MRKVRFFLLLLGLCWFSGQTAFLYAQEDNDEDDSYDEDIPLEDDWDGYVTDLYSRGDQLFVISAGVIFPTVFYNNGRKINHNFKPPVGGAMSLSYLHFLGSHLFLGGEIGFKFNYTLGENTIFLIPIGARVGWQFVLHRFEFPVSMTTGIAPQRYLNNSYPGFFLKAAASAFFRFNPDWSFGLNTDWTWYPQWPKENGKPAPHKNMDANILGLTLAARYHF
jgi:hypothetical protein